MRLKRATLFLSLGALNCNSGAVPTEPAASAAAETPTVSSQSALVTGGAGIVLTVLELLKPFWRRPLVGTAR